MSRSIRTPDEIEAAAANWVARRDGGLTSVELAEFEVWKSADPRHALALDEFESMWEELGRPNRTGVSSEIRREMGVLRRRRRRRIALATTSVALLLLLGLFVVRREQPTRVESSLIVMRPERRTLPDGSIVELKEGARLTVSFAATGSGLRRVTLQRGEAHFNVAKHHDRPFIVTAGGIDVCAVGTEFCVDLAAKHVEVMVTEGRVAVDQQGKIAEDPSAPKVEMRSTIDAGNRMVIGLVPDGSHPVAVPVSTTELSDRLAWRHPRVEISRAPLADVVALVNPLNAVKLRIDDPRLSSVTLSGLFRADDPETLVRALEGNFGIKAERRESEIVLRAAH